MGSTSSVLQRKLLRGIDESGDLYALLHGADALLAGALESDLDIMVRRSPWHVTCSLRSCLRRHGIHLIFLWESDVGTLNTFWWDRADRAGCQLDILYDPKGGNRFGFRTEAAWEHVETAPQGIAALDAPAQHTYLVAKRLAKGQTERYVEMRRSGTYEINKRLLSRRTKAALAMTAHVDALVGPYGKVTITGSRLRRLGARVRWPQGIVCHTDLKDSDNAATVSALSQVLPRLTVTSKLGVVQRARVAWLPQLVIVTETGSARASDMIGDLEARATSILSSRC